MTLPTPDLLGMRRSSKSSFTTRHILQSREGHLGEIESWRHLLVQPWVCQAFASLSLSQTLTLSNDEHLGGSSSRTFCLIICHALDASLLTVDRSFFRRCSIVQSIWLNLMLVTQYVHKPLEPHVRPAYLIWPKSWYRNRYHLGVIQHPHPFALWKIIYMGQSRDGAWNDIQTVASWIVVFRVLEVGMALLAYVFPGYEVILISFVRSGPVNASPRSGRLKLRH